MMKRESVFWLEHKFITDLRGGGREGGFIFLYVLSKIVDNKLYVHLKYKITKEPILK